jgi:hypothetical protein
VGGGDVAAWRAIGREHVRAWEDRHSPHADSEEGDSVSGTVRLCALRRRVAIPPCCVPAPARAVVPSPHAAGRPSGASHACSRRRRRRRRRRRQAQGLATWRGRRRRVVSNGGTAVAPDARVAKVV